MYKKEENGRIILRDKRHYWDSDGSPNPSVTEIISSTYPMSQFFLKKLTENPEEMKRRRVEGGKRGTKVHEMIEDYFYQRPVRFDESEISEWEMYVKAINWIKAHVTAVEFVEVQFVNSTLGYGGTADLLCHSYGERWLIDWKTSNTSLDEDKWKIQLMAYKRALEIHLECEIHRVGVMWLNAKTKRDQGMYQGKGWRLIECDTEEWDKYNEAFDCCHKLYQMFIDDRPFDKEFPIEMEGYENKILNKIQKP